MESSCEKKWNVLCYAPYCLVYSKFAIHAMAEILKQIKFNEMIMNANAKGQMRCCKTV